MSTENIRQPKPNLIKVQFYMDQCIVYHTMKKNYIYSGVPNSGTGTNNSTGWEKYENLIIVQDGINVIGGIYPKIK